MKTVISFIFVLAARLPESSERPASRVRPRRGGYPLSPRSLIFRCRTGPRGPAIGVAVLTSFMLAAVVGCSTAPAASVSAGTGRQVEVVAAENFWGSIARQIGGRHARVVSIITNPDTDPHSYEPTAGDARTIAGAQFVIENGVGYDPWVPKLLAADQQNTGTLDVGTLLGVPAGGNPHRWYRS